MLGWRCGYWTGVRSVFTIMKWTNVFASAEKHGNEPCGLAQQCRNHSACCKEGWIVKHVRWQVFRHSFGTLLKGNAEDVKTVAGVTATREQRSNAGHVYAGPHAREAGSTTQGYCDDWTHLDPRISDNRCKCLIAKVGRVAQLVEQCPFKAWVAGSSPAALTIVFQSLRCSGKSSAVGQRRRLHQQASSAASRYRSRCHNRPPQPSACLLSRVL